MMHRRHTESNWLWNGRIGPIANHERRCRNRQGVSVWGAQCPELLSAGRRLSLAVQRLHQHSRDFIREF